MYYVNTTISFIYAILNLIGGFVDAVNPRYPLSLYYHSKNMRRIFNSIIMINTLLLVSNYVLYSIGKYLSFLNYFNWIVWFIPMWIFSDYANRSLQSELMDLMYKSKYEKKSELVRSESVSSKNVTESNRSKQITDILYETLFFACIHVLLFLSNSFWSKTLYLMGYSLVCSYSLLSYRLIYTQNSLQNRMKLFEKYWIYFIFYGLPYGLIYVLLPTPVSYPCFYMLVGLTLPNTMHVLPKQGFILPFKIFYIPEYLVNYVGILLPKVLQKKK